MRRSEADARGAPPFRVLGDTGGPVYVVPSPPPTLAPEPYKISTSSSSSNRTRRRSSFVIIAEARPATPTSRSPSPSLGTGRVSPFRGRGFKGPPPRAQSRPQTPEVKETRRHARIDRRMSTSQQNSPKRSLIPQPERRRSVSLSKTETGRASPKYGRRATSKTHLEVPKVAPGRRGSLKVPGLSPIQGTPTRPLDKKPAQNGLSKKSSPVKLNRRNSVLPPPKSGGRTTNITVKTKPPSKPTKTKTQEQPISPSKIPVKRGSMSEIKGGQISRRGSLAKLGAPKLGEKNEKLLREQKDQKTDSKSAADKQHVTTSKKTEQKTSEPIASKRESDDGVDGKEPSTKGSERRDDEPSLMDLLKQSSGASGTSSVVNTTTVTAAQPLKIDAIGLGDFDGHKTAEKEAEVKRRNPDSGRKNGAARPTAINVQGSNLEDYSVQNSPKMETGGEDETKNGTPSRGESRHQKNGSGTLGSARSVAPSGKSSASNEGRQNTGAGQNMEMGGSSIAGRIGGDENGNQNSNPDSVNQYANSGRAIQPVGSAQHRTHADAANQRTHDLMKEKDSTVTDSTAKQPDAQSMSIKSSGGSATPQSSVRSVNDEKVSPVNQTVSSSNGSYGSSVVVGSIRRLQNEQHMGSATSLKSTAGLSIGSADTGVSVNTVRGVSSAREKHGMHMVKQPQGIETLSGNVVHLEQNGEPVVPETRPSDHSTKRQNRDPASDSEDSEKSRWKRILDRCCGCCKCKCNCCDHGRSMRCLACRRGLKPQMNRPQPMFQGTTSKEPSGCLSKLKTSSRCCRLPNWKGCARGSRVAPAEDGGCCPPERRCGAVFRRLCGRCTCRRQDAPQIRNVQAKQSLTSVVAPVLPEEPQRKLPEVLVEHNAPMRGAIPCLPIPLAWFCLVWNVLIPGTGTFWSGLFNLCVGQPRFSAVATPRARIGAFVVNTVVGVGQLFTVLFCLVGWGWSIWWGVTMVRLARKYKRFRDSEAVTNDIEARGGGVDQGSTVPPGVPSQVLRGYERAR